MARLLIVLRVLLGLPFLIFGLNVFVGFIEPPPAAEMAPDAVKFLDALTETGFMHPLRGAVELLCGVLLLTGLAVPLALVMLAPVLVHIVGYHVWLDPMFEGRVISGGLVLIFLACCWGWRARLAQLLLPRPG